MRKLLLATMVSLVIAMAGVPAWAEEHVIPEVVVSIKPLHFLVSGVMEGVSEPQLLVKGGGSPHDYAMRPSDARMLADAELIVWVGPQLESFLVKPLTTLGKKARQLEFGEVLESEMLPVREGGAWGSGDHAHHLHSDQHHLVRDPHFWLDPHLAKQVVEKTAAELVAIDPVHSEQYLRNAAGLKGRLDTLDAELKIRLAPVRDIPYLVFHDAYQYFEVAYGLNVAGSVTANPERRPGARGIAEIRQRIVKVQARCVFSEPQFEPRLVATVIEGTGARTGVLDPLGVELPAETESYFRLMNHLADNLIRGLQD